MTTKTYMVSSHGSLYGNQTFPMPAGVKLFLHCNLDESISYDKGNMLLAQFVNKKLTAGQHEYGDGAVTPNFCFWSYEASQGTMVRWNGVFRRKSSRKIMDLVGTTEARPVQLKYLVDTLKKDGTQVDIHWLACTTRSAVINPLYSRPQRL